MALPLADAVSAALHEPIVALRRVAGGDINEAFEARLAGGRRVFVKTHASADPRMLPCEAEGLRWLDAAGAVRVPGVLAVSDPASPGPAFLVLEFIAGRARAEGFDASLGRALARLHRHGAPGFGFASDNFIGSLPQSNRAHATWPAFYLAERLEPQIRRAVDTGAGPSRWTASLERLGSRLSTLAGDDEPPARLHGDLWSGNVMTDGAGAPVLVDPAVYGGHREMDLAMLQLFGSPGRELFDAYGEAWPLAPGHRDRVRLHQLYPLLVHVNLFGGSYVAAADACLRAYL